MGSWVNNMMIDKVVRRTNDLTLYVELAELFGPRNLQRDRYEAKRMSATRDQWPSLIRPRLATWRCRGCFLSIFSWRMSPASLWP